MVKKENIIKKIYGYPGVAVPTDYNIKYDDVSEKAEKDCVESFGLPGKILFISKSDGEKLCKEKDEKFVSNANIFMENCKVWHGDFILSYDTKLDLKKLAKKYQKDFYLLKEHDGRFLNQVPTKKYLQSKSVFAAISAKRL